ncbi:MAG: methylenetetrahydrofolate reductase [Syntrophomonadaceae bacterium]|jgi:methylenetetrahydrofolate reductase (NADPH)|nr:methylenetetrahydrofolate reductase [Syntrophomonadaceae bacterium]
MTGSNLERVLKEGHFAVTAEIGPPKSCNAAFVQRKADLLKGYADVFNITDNQTAIVRMSSIAAAVLIQQKGLEPVIQMTCRDRNRIGLQSDLLGAAALGIKNVLCLTGDHQSFGNHPQAKNVFDLDSIQLIKTIKDMRDEGRFLCGEEMKVRPDVFIGCVENPFADPFEFRALRLQKKIEAGADFVQTQCVLDMKHFRHFMDLINDRGLTDRVAVLAGVMPIKSARMARYMQKNVAGMMVPDELCERLETAADVQKEAVDIVVEQIAEVKEIPGVRGVHIMAVAWEEVVPEIVRRAGLYPRPF